MAPTPGDGDSDIYFGKQMPPEIPSFVPTVVTSTYTHPLHTDTVAYLISPYPNPYLGVGASTSQFSNLAQASQAAASLASMVASYNAAGVPYVAMTSQFGGGYQASPSTPVEENSPTHSAYSTAPVNAPPVPAPVDSGEHHGPHAGKFVAMIAMPIIAILATVLICFFCVRHYKRKAAKAHAVERASRLRPEMVSKSVGAGQMTTNTAHDERAHLSPPTVTIPTTSTSALIGNSPSSGPEQPVILSTTMNNGFYTGIDTSDHVSLSDQRSEASADTFGEEPPPPYRPRSVPPISRETSVRTVTPGVARNSSCRSSRNGEGPSLLRRSNEVRSPFDDPEEEDEDDAMSDVSTIRGEPSSSRRNNDEMSAVSDLSYQRDPPSSHSRL